MTKYEILTLVASAVALIISSVSLFSSSRSRRITNELAKRQLELLDKDRKLEGKANIQVSLEGRFDDRRLVFKNIGKAKAFNVFFRIENEGKGNPLAKNEFAEKFPIKELGPGRVVTLKLITFLDAPLKFTSVIRWTDQDGTERESTDHITV